MVERVDMNERLLDLTPETPLPYYNIAHGSSSQQDPQYTQPPPSLYSLAVPTPPAHQQGSQVHDVPPLQQQPMSYDLRICTPQQSVHSQAPPPQQQQMSYDVHAHQQSVQSQAPPSQQQPMSYAHQQTAHLQAPPLPQQPMSYDVHAHQQAVHSQAPPFVPPPQQQQPVSYDVRAHQQAVHSQAPPLVPPTLQQQQMSIDLQIQPRLTEEIHEVPLTGPQQFSPLDLLTCLVTVACLCFCPFGLCAVILAARARRRAARSKSIGMELFVAGLLSCLSIFYGVMIVLGLLVWAISITVILATS